MREGRAGEGSARRVREEMGGRARGRYDVCGERERAFGRRDDACVRGVRGDGADWYLGMLMVMSGVGGGGGGDRIHPEILKGASDTGYSK